MLHSYRNQLIDLSSKKLLLLMLKIPIPISYAPSLTELTWQKKLNFLSSLIIYDFIQLCLFISLSTGLYYVIYQMQSIPKRDFNISKFYDSLKIDSNMFQPYKIIDDSINVQDQGIF